jgi:hypothetical protein
VFPACDALDGKAKAMRSASMNVATHKRYLWILLILSLCIPLHAVVMIGAHLRHTAWTFKDGVPAEIYSWPRHLTVSCGWGPRPDCFVLTEFVFSNISLHQIRNSTRAKSALLLQHQTAAVHG